SHELVGVRSVRRVQVRKSRGSASLGGLHQLEITDDGLQVYPRIERAMPTLALESAPSEERLSAGCSGIDALLHGGLPAASVTLLAGPPGSGKTTFGLHFLGCASADEPGLLFGFIETPARVRAKAQRLNISLPEDNRFHMIWNPM